MNEIVLEVNGRSGSVELYENRLIIKQKLSKLKRMLTSGDKEIFLDSITNVNFKSANSMTWGFIQFETTQNAKKLSKGSLMFSPTDEYSINFSRKQQPEFEQLKSEINRLRDGVKPQATIPNTDIGELEKLANLKEKGIITQEEFDQKKKQILGL